MSGVTHKIMSFFKTNTTKNYSKPRRVKNFYGCRKKLRKPKRNKSSKKSRENKIKSVTSFS